MIDDTTTKAPRFIEVAPDWSKPVIVEHNFNTSIAESQSENRQRSRWRKQPRYGLSYTFPAMTPAEFSARRSAVISELSAPLVVPIWTDDFDLVAMTSAHVAQLGESLTKKKFKAGSYAYFVQAGLASTFRKILSVSGDSITFVSATVPAFTEGALVYPCILGYRPKDSAAFVLNKIDETDENLTIEEL